MRPRMYGSTDITVVRTTASPGPGGAISTSAKLKFDGLGPPGGS